MTGPDDEFDDFLRRRRPLFRRAGDDDLEPPAELDRIVLRQAREAIEPERPQRVFRGPRWAAPIALAATILVALSVVFHGHLPGKDPVGEVTVRTVARDVTPPARAEAAGEARDASQPAPAPAREPVAERGSVVVELQQRAAESTGSAAAPPPFVSDAEASRYAPPPPAAPGPAEAAPAAARAKMQAANEQPVDVAAPAWRRDSTTWLAEIERLRAAGETARADAETAEYNRQHRAYAGAPDR